MHIRKTTIKDKLLRRERPSIVFRSAFAKTLGTSSHADRCCFPTGSNIATLYLLDAWQERPKRHQSSCCARGGTELQKTGHLATGPKQQENKTSFSHVRQVISPCRGFPRINHVAMATGALQGLFGKALGGHMASGSASAAPSASCVKLSWPWDALRPRPVFWLAVNLALKRETRPFRILGGLD